MPPRAPPPARAPAGQGADLTTILRTARQTGHLRLPGTISLIPDSVWEVNSENYGHASWWELVPIAKLSLTQNGAVAEVRVRSLLELEVAEVSYCPKLTCFAIVDDSLLKLTRLDLVHCGLTSIDVDFSRCASLSELRIHHNALAALPPALPPKMTVLDASENRLASITAEFPGSIVELNLSGNRLGSLASLAGLANLQRLVVSRNELAGLLEVPRAVVVVDARQNRLSDLAVDRHNTCLKEVVIGFNRFSHVPGPLPDSVEIIDLSSNPQLESLGDDLPARLGRIDCSNCALTNLPDSMGKLRFLKSVVLDGNPIKAIRRDVMRSCVALQEYLRTRSAEPEPVSHLHDPHRGNGAGAGPGAAPAAERLPWDFSKMGLTALPPELLALPAGTTRIAKIDLSGNKLTSLDEAAVKGWIESGVMIEELSLKDNDITSITPFVGKIKGIKTLLLTGNPLRNVPQSKIQAGSAAVIELLSARCPQ